MATAVKVVAVLFVGLIAFYLVAPTSGAGDRCFAVPGFEVPCDITLAALAGIGSAVLVAVVLWVIGRRW